MTGRCFCVAFPHKALHDFVLRFQDHQRRTHFLIIILIPLSSGVYIIILLKCLSETDIILTIPECRRTIHHKAVIKPYNTNFRIDAKSGTDAR